jgi:hypothetical protein
MQGQCEVVSSFPLLLKDHIFEAIQGFIIAELVGH